MSLSPSDADPVSREGHTILYLRRSLARWMLVLLLLSLLGCTSFRAAKHYQRGTAELDRGEVEQAVVDLRAAAELAPHASEVQNHLGLALAADGQDEAAHAAFRRAVELDCDNAAAKQNLAAAEARAHVIENGPTRSDASE